MWDSCIVWGDFAYKCAVFNGKSPELHINLPDCNILSSLNLTLNFSEHYISCTVCAVIGFEQDLYTLSERAAPYSLSVTTVRGFLPQDLVLEVSAIPDTACKNTLLYRPAPLE